MGCRPRILAGLVLAAIITAGCTTITGTDNTPATPEPGLAPTNVEGYAIFQDYIDVIGAAPTSGSPFGFDQVEVTATVESINEHRVCPYDKPVSECPIEPYPKVTGTIQVQHIYDYDREGNNTQQDDEDTSTGNETINTSNAEPGTRGTYDRPASPKWEPLQDGETTTALFVLTTDQVIVRNAANPATTDGTATEPTPEQESTDDPGTTVAKDADNVSTDSGYKPIPAEDGTYVFTTQVQGTTDTRHTLPGLSEGDTFNATIGYAKTAYIREYELLD